MSDNKIIDFSVKKDENELVKTFDALGSSLTQLFSDNEGTEMIEKILSLSEDRFEQIAPIFLNELERNLNDNNTRLVLIEALRSSVDNMDALYAEYNEVCEQIDKQLTQYSQQKRDFIKRILMIILNATYAGQASGQKTVLVPISLCHPEAKLPEYAHITDAGLDIYAVEDITIHPGETKLIKTGIKVAIPSGYELQVRPKSGRTLKTKMRVANSPGTIDTGYRQEVGVIIDNIEPPIKNITYEPVFKEDGTIDYLKVTSIEYGSNMYIGKGEKFAQLVLSENPKVAWSRVENIEDFEGDRGGGFGSSSIYSKDDTRYKSDIEGKNEF